MTSRDEENLEIHTEIDALKRKLAQLEGQEAFLEQIDKLRRGISVSWQRRDIIEAQRLYNRAWEMEREHGKQVTQKDELGLTKEAILRVARNMGFR